jgi:LmbE family N-acetylglucosaminyl deacetylase/tetratricopeptide (TPR) repeat protein
MPRWLQPVLLGVTLLMGSLPSSSATLEDRQAAVRALPGSAEAWDRLGQAYARERRFAEAQEAYTKALKLAPASKPVLYHIALTYAWSGNYPEAERRYADLLAQQPRDHELRIDYGQTLAWDQRYAEAAKQYDAVLATNPRHIEALRHRGILEAWQGRYDAALALLDRGLAVEPKNPRLIADRAEVLSWKGDLAAAALGYEALVKLAPKSVTAWLNLARVYAWQGRTRPARETYEKVLVLDPANIDAYIGLARVYRDNLQYAEAEKSLRAGLTHAPTDARLTGELAALAAKKSWNLETLVERIKPVLLVLILSLLARHIWRYRRVLRRRHVAARLLLPTMPALALLIAVVYVLAFIGGAYRHEFAAAAQMLDLAALGALLVLTLTLIWLVRFERPQRRQTVLAIGAHPDDIEFGCGATLLRLREEGARTYGLVLTSGERGYTASGTDAVRRDEARAAANVLALTDLAFQDFPDTRLHEHKEAIRAAIEAALERWQPDILFTHNSHDVHTDHKTVFEATREAARGAYTILCYENPNTPPTFHPGYFIDVSDYLEDKIVALARHKTQMGKSYADPAVIRATASFRGNQARVALAEGFETVRVLEKAAAS